MKFLKAEWRKLAIINYNIDLEIIIKYLPKGTELDFYQGKCYVSLVGFMFLNTKLLGLPIPFHRNFEEVNLRFYVKKKEGNNWKRGVVFIKEIVPKAALSFVANSIYKENYKTMPMKNSLKQNDKEISVKYSWKLLPKIWLCRWKMNQNLNLSLNIIGALPKKETKPLNMKSVIRNGIGMSLKVIIWKLILVKFTEKILNF